ncbi:MAG: quinone oxidoreductase [Gordonia sp. (in: high G+C Gram-positive bacteria)]|uniref:quinone oxidoreductase family protein n=1 Tax=Gordonia sp. (in: high G+C Gram-positive bacteria) TaxID=84139 RepID=UPI003BB5602A
MRAIRVMSTGGPEVLGYGGAPDPRPEAGQLLVRVRAAGVNFIDTYYRAGLYPIGLPYIPGLEGAGEVVALGPGAEDAGRFAVGQRVAWCDSPGSYAELAVVPSHRAVSVPEGVADELAGSSLLRGLTAHYLLYPSPTVPTGTSPQWRPGDTVLIHAGAGGVGLILTQLAKHAGLRVITTVSNDKKEMLSRAAGADDVLRYDDFAATVRELTDGRGVPVVFDGVGATTFDGSLAATAIRGTVVLFGAASGPVPPFDLQRLNPLGSLTVTRPTLAHFIADPEEFEWRAGAYLGAVVDGSVQARVGLSYPLADAAQAHRDLASRRTIGTTVLLP